MKKFTEFFLLIAIIISFFIFLWFFSVKSENYVRRIPETDLNIRKSINSAYNAEEDATVVKYDLLDDEGRILCTRRQGNNPFVNVSGVVYIPQKGIYDCREENLRILKLDDYHNFVQMLVVDSGRALRIIVDRNCYIYNLRTKELSAE